MPAARKLSVVPGQPGFFHCISRCVRRAWLCGRDPVSGNNYDHRREWMLERMRVLTTCFAIDVYAYALMSNHYHIVFYIDPERVDSWSDGEVIKKWKTLWNWRTPETDPVIPKNLSAETIQQWRKRLGDVSWVMRLMNEPMARLANAEDEVKGHFWESRFKCNPLLDEQGLTTCMVYVDLNPIKAGVARTPMESDYTSIQQRICQMEEEVKSDSIESKRQKSNDGRPVLNNTCEGLVPVSSANMERSLSLDISLQSYIELVESTAEAIREQHILKSTDALMALGIKPSAWIRAVKDFARLFRTAAGSEMAFTEFMKRTGRTRRQDAAARRLLFL